MWPVSSDQRASDPNQPSSALIELLLTASQIGSVNFKLHGHLFTNPEIGPNPKVSRKTVNISALSVMGS